MCQEDIGCLYETTGDHNQRIHALESRVRELESRLSELEWLRDDIANLKQRVDMIEFRERRR